VITRPALTADWAQVATTSDGVGAKRIFKRISSLFNADSPPDHESSSERALMSEAATSSAAAHASSELSRAEQHAQATKPRTIADLSARCRVPYRLILSGTTWYCQGTQRAPFRWDSWNLFDAQAPEKLEADKARTPLRIGAPGVSAHRTPPGGAPPRIRTNMPMLLIFSHPVDFPSRLSPEVLALGTDSPQVRAPAQTRA
jgi:hypothetical protein